MGKSVWIIIVIALLVVAGAVYLVIPKYYFANTVDECLKIYASKSTLGANYENFKEFKQYEECVARVKDKDPNYVTDSACESSDLKEICYFKKALDNKDYRYCKNVGNPDRCINNLASMLKDDSICKYSQYVDICLKSVNECIAGVQMVYCNNAPTNYSCPSNTYCNNPDSDFSCDGLKLATIKVSNDTYNRCMQTYGLVSAYKFQ